jgi:AcrR family transcriptional regulator
VADAPDDVPERILRAADEVFRCCGFEGTEMRAIAARAGTSVGTIYNYFPSKWGLFTRVLFDRWEAVKHDVQRVAADPGLDWRGRVTGILEVQMRYVAENGPVWMDIEAMAGGGQRLPPGGDPAVLRQITDWLIAEVVGVLAGADHERWRRHPERERLALALVSAAAARARRRPGETEQNADFLRALLAA